MAQRRYKSFKQAKFRANSMSKWDGNRFYYVKNTPFGYVVKRGKGYKRGKR